MYPPVQNHYTILFAQVHLFHKIYK